MVSYIVEKSNYVEILCLSKDEKPGADSFVPNGSLLTEIDSGKNFRYNSETGLWIEQGKPFPVSLASTSSGYSALYSDGTEVSVKPNVDHGFASFCDNGVMVTCKAKTSKAKK